MKSVHITRQGNGLPLVLIHGWGFDSRIWNTVLPKLIDNYEVYCVDLPGFGLSPVMDWDIFKSSLLAQLPATFALGGWSLGGMVATRLILEEPSRVTHLINIASSPCFLEDSLWPGIPKTTLLTFSERLITDPDKVLNEFMALQLRGQRFQIFTSPTIHGLKMGLDWILSWDFRNELVRIQSPVLYIFGRLDAIIPVKTMSVMQEKFPGFEYILINKAAHALFLSHLATLESSINSFML